MAALAPESTARLRVHYTGPRGAHTIEFRGGPETGAQAMVTDVRQFLSTISPNFWNGTAFGSADYAGQLSTIFNPVPWGAPIVVANQNAPTANDAYGVYARAEGRSPDGRRVSWTFFNIVESAFESANNRITPGEGGQLEPFITALQALADAHHAVTISSQIPIVKDYLNTGINAHVKKVSRRTIA